MVNQVLIKSSLLYGINHHTKNLSTAAQSLAILYVEAGLISQSSKEV